MPLTLLASYGRPCMLTCVGESSQGSMVWMLLLLRACCRALGAAGVKSLLAVPISFVSEHIETLEEIDMEYR